MLALTDMYIHKAGCGFHSIETCLYSVQYAFFQMYKLVYRATEIYSINLFVVCIIVKQVTLYLPQF